MMAVMLAAIPLAIWLYLLLGRGLFWLARENESALSLPTRGAAEAGSPEWPSVTAVVPARNEAAVIAESVGSLLRQRYGGHFSIILVDDGSTDGTAERAINAAHETGAADRLTVIRGSEPPAGWTGKLWAMNRGVAHLEESGGPDFLLFTDADIAYTAPDALARLVRAAVSRGAVLTSFMVKLRCESLSERLLVPAFVYFFAKLYPFSRVNDPRSTTAAAAGGCMLVRREALAGAGGLQAIRHALIDDCALGTLMKRQGPIWLGLAETVVSLRPYPSFNDIRAMVVRSAYAELRYSPLRLAGAVAGMLVTYLAPPLLTFLAEGAERFLGAAAWLLMAISFWPMLRLYGRSPAWGLALPLIAAVYTGFTVESAVQHWRGKGGAWKGRYQAVTGRKKAAGA